MPKNTLKEKLEKAKAALKGNPNDAELHNNLGSILYELDYNKKALEHFKEASRLNPTEPAYLWNQGLALKYNQDDIEAAKCFNKAGNIYYKNNNFQEALDAYEEAHQLNLQNALYLYNKSWALKKLNRLEDAKGCFLEAGNLYYEQNQFEKALKCYQKAHNLDTEDADYLYNQGLALEKLGRQEEAASCFLKAGNAYYSNDPNEALKCYQKASTLDPKNKDLLLKAVENSYVDIVQDCLNHGADPKACNQEYYWIEFE